MKLSGLNPRWILLSGLSFAFFLALGGTTQLAQTQKPTGHLSDLAGVVNENTRQELETLLTNLKTKTGIQFDIAVVQTTGGKSIEDFSLQLAKEWGVGVTASPRKSLLLVVAVDEKTSFTRFSRPAMRDLPEGVLGDLGQRMRGSIEAGEFGEGLDLGVQFFVSALAKKLAFNVDELNETPTAITAPSPPAKVDDTATDVAGPTAISQPVKESNSTPVKPATARREPVATKAKRSSSAADDEAEAEAVESTLVLPMEERIPKLKAFLEDHPDSKSKLRASELLSSAHAALGDERLKNHDSAGGVAELMLAISEAPLTVTDKFFSGVIAQIPLNLYVRGENAAAIKAAQDVESKFGNDAKHLIALSAFYVRVEQGSEATRLAKQAVQLAPDLAEAHQALGLALHVSLRLDEATGEYKRALELDPTAKVARRSLADLLRASGKAEEAVTLYKQQLEADPQDRGSRTGLILSLLDLNRIEEAKPELEKTLSSDPKNLTLLAGAAYWFAAHNDNDTAVVLALQAIRLEPRYSWSQIALARGLIGQRNPLEAERAIRFARQYGKFPTLDYELANVLVAASLFDEAAEVLRQSFTMKNDEIETRLGGQVPAHNASFLELLAPERRASIFQFTAADSENNAKLLKSLLKFSLAIDLESNGGTINEAVAVATAKEFAAGDDPARVFRELYAANRLLQRGIAYQTAFELSEAARTSAEAGLSIPALTVAVQADELRPIRARAIAGGGTPDIPESPRNVLSNLLRGRIEDTSGWARLNQDKLDDAVDHLKRAIAILPEGTPAAHTSLWRLAVALERQDKKSEALSYYIKAYNAGAPDPARRAVIEQLYRKVNGSLDGLDEKIGAGAQVAASQAVATPDATAKPVETAPLESPATIAQNKPDTTPTPPAVEPDQTSEKRPAAESPTPSPEPSVSPVKEISGHTGVAPPPLPTPTPEATPESTPTPTATPSAEPAPTPTPADTSPVAQLIKPTRSTATITGQVKDANENPLENVVVVLISPQGTVLTATTDERGGYSFTVATTSPSRSYRIIPSKEGFAFDPLDRMVSIESDDVKELNFVGKGNK